MIQLATQFSKYVVLLGMMIYTYLGFSFFRYSEKSSKQTTLNVMFGFMVFMHFLNYLVIYLNTDNIKLWYLYGSQLLLILFLSVIYHWVYPNINRLVLQHMMMLLTIGFVFLARLSYSTAVRHTAFTAVSVVGCLVVPIIIEKFKMLEKFASPLVILGLGILVFVLFFGVEINGAKNWISIAGVKLQPSEFVKLIFVFAMAGLLSKVSSFKQVVIVSSIAACYVLVLVAEKDLGGALIFFLTYICMLTVATEKVVYLFAGLVAGSGAAVVAYRLFAHVRVRVLAWQDPWSYISNQGFQVAQGLFAIGTGGWVGMGLCQGLPKVIPVVTSDFIFAAISEEMGAIYAICIILICISCFIMFINISMKLRESFYRLIALGFSMMYILPVFLNIGGVTKLIPSTGVTIPLISAGGSSMIMTIIMFNVIQGLYLLNQRKERRTKEMRRDVVGGRDA